jgi:hypothetical protein
MSNTSARARRLLVVVSGDYGELGAALYFVQGLGLAVPPLLLLPASLEQLGQDEGGVRTGSYHGAADLVRQLTDFAPDAVLLATGYLLTVNTGLTAVDVFTLLLRLRRLGVTLLTTDPFLGLHPRPVLPSPRQLLHPGGRVAVVAWAYLVGLSFRVAILGLALRGAWHVYPAPTVRLPTLAGPRRLSYCNPAAAVIDAAAHASMRGRPVWLFVLSRVDHTLQLRLRGPDFLTTLLQRLEECIALGCHAVVVGPAALVAAVDGHFGREEPLSAFSDLSHQRYIEWLMASEYAFFWNLLSFSLIHRVLAARPVFFFDAGHFTHLFPDVAEAGARLFYGGWRPALRPLEQPFHLHQLDIEAAAVVQAFRRIGSGLREGATPAQVLAIAGSARAGPGSRDSSQPLNE